MTENKVSCVLLADKHHGLSEGIRGLLETAFGSVVMVADGTSLTESAHRLQPEVVVVDLSIFQGNEWDWLQTLRQDCPNLKVVALSVHDEPTVRQAALNAGADAFVLKRSISTDLLETIDSVRDDRTSH